MTTHNHTRAGWALLAMSLVPLVGCTSVNRAASTTISWKDGAFSYTSSKDLTLKKLSIDPKTGIVTLEDVTAQVDQAAVNAAAAARISDAQILIQALDLAKQAGAIAAKAAIP
jgi:hypothetical protein